MEHIMFSTERSDFGSTIIGYFLSAIALLLGGLKLADMQFNWFDDTSYAPFTVLAVLLICASAVALWKAYIIDGMTFMIAGLISFAFAGSNLPVFLLVITIAAAVTAFMAFRVSDVFVFAVNVTLGIGALIGMLAAKVDFFVDNPCISGLFLIVSGLIAGYLCISDWMLVQDISMDYEEEMFGEDGCECGDDCECHKDSEECQTEEKEQ